MAYKKRIAYLATNTADAVGKIKDDMVAMGWVLYDDQFSGSDYYILTSQGETGTEPKVYIMLRHNESADVIGIKLYLYWNASTHVGTVMMYSLTYSGLGADDNASFYIWVYGDKDTVGLMSKVGVTYDTINISLIKKFWTVKGTLASGVSSGSDVVLTLGAGEADDFREKDYQIMGIGNEGRDWVTVNNVNAGSNQITIASLPRNYGAGAIIGQIPYPWLAGAYNYFFILKYDGVGTANEASSRGIFGDLPGQNLYMDPDKRGDQEYVIQTCGVLEYAHQSYLGYIEDIIGKATLVGLSHEDTLGSGEKDSGTSSGSNTSTTLNDTTKSWTINDFQNKAIIITGGIGAGQIAKIASNTGTQITVSTSDPDDTWAITPDATSVYVICDNAWRYFVNCCYKEV